MITKEEMCSAAQAYLQLSHQINALQEQLDEVKEKLSKGMNEMGLESGTFDGIKVSYKNVDSQRFDTKTFKQDYVDLYDKYVSTVSYSRLMVR